MNKALLPGFDVYSWEGVEHTGRVDNAAINFRPGCLTAFGTSQAGDYAASWALTTTTGWVTKLLTVSVHGISGGTAGGVSWSRHLELERTDDGVWSSRVRTSGEDDLPAPGIDDSAALAEALDCDLGFCPVTNTMPILRLDLLTKDKAPADETELTMARVDMPSLQVRPSSQVYTQVKALQPGRHALVLHSSGSRGFTTELTVDEDGTVVEYPGLARRVS